MDRGSFMVYIKTDDRCKDVAEDVETSFGVSNYDLDNPIWTGGGGRADLAPPVRFFSVAPEVVMEGL